MPAKAAEIQLLGPNQALWFVYEPAVKCELFSTALRLPDNTLALIDPIPLTGDAHAELLALGQPSCIILTNQNHARGATALRDQLQLPVYCHPAAIPELELTPDRMLTTDHLIESLSMIPIPGAPAGEIAIWQPSTNTLIIGDALIHLNGYGFTFLPDKYAPDPKLMRRSLLELASLEPAQILFAHGFPIINDAAKRLRALFEDD